MGTRIYTVFDSPIGELVVVAESGKLACIYFGEEELLEENSKNLTRNDEDPLLKTAMTQLSEYFSGLRKTFTLPLHQSGTDFQRSVWKELEKIPYGETRSYAEIAEAIGNPKAVRAVGQANKANRFPIIIPCHRVIGKNKQLTGYAGTRTDIKEKLLEIEGIFKN